MKIKEQKVEELLKNLSSSSPTPGGGAAAALAGSLAASLVEMVANITIGKPKYKNAERELVKIKSRANSLKVQLLKLADDDAKAFDSVITAYKRGSNFGIKKALTLAIEIPGETKKLSAEILKLARRVEKIGNKNAVSDAKSAGYLAKAAGLSAKENIKINKKLLSKLSRK